MPRPVSTSIPAPAPKPKSTPVVNTDTDNDGVSNASTTVTILEGALAYQRAGSLCGGSILPANFAETCTQLPTQNGGALISLLPGENNIWWIAIDSNGNWPEGGAQMQTINIVPQLNIVAENAAGNEVIAIVEGQSIIINSNSFDANGDDLQFTWAATGTTNANVPDGSTNSSYC